MNENLSILDIIKMIAKWWWIIAIVAVIGAIGMYTYSEYFEDEIYVSKGSFYVSSAANNNLDYMTISTLNANARFSETYIQLAKSDIVLEKVREKLIEEGYAPISVSKLRNMLSFTAMNETEVLEVQASDNNPDVACAVTNAILTLAPQEIKRVVKSGGAEVVDAAKMPTSPSYPNVLTRTLSGFLIGFLAGCALVFVIEFFDLRIKPDNNLEQMYGIPVIGNIPEIRK